MGHSCAPRAWQEAFDDCPYGRDFFSVTLPDHAKAEHFHSQFPNAGVQVDWLTLDFHQPSLFTWVFFFYGYVPYALMILNVLLLFFSKVDGRRSTSSESGVALMDSQRGPARMASRKFSVRKMNFLSFAFLITIFNEAILKRIFVQQRPEYSCVTSCGMPSGHSTLSVGYFVLYFLDCAFRVYPQSDEQERLRMPMRERLCRPFKDLSWTALSSLTPLAESHSVTHRQMVSRTIFWMMILFPVPLSRIAVGDHTPLQVFVGSFIGAFEASIWTLLTRRLQHKYSCFVARHLCLPQCRWYPREATYTFSGEMGIRCDDDGIVQEVIANMRADTKGIRAGHKIVNVGTNSFSKEIFRSAENHGFDYHVTVEYGEPDTAVWLRLFNDFALPYFVWRSIDGTNAADPEIISWYRAEDEFCGYYFIDREIARVQEFSRAVEEAEQAVDVDLPTSDEQKSSLDAILDDPLGDQVEVITVLQDVPSDTKDVWIAGIGGDFDTRAGTERCLEGELNGVRSFFYSLRCCQQATHRFEHGKNKGLELSEHGTVLEVTGGGQADEKGIKVGDRVLKVGDTPYSPDALKALAEGSSDYTITCQVGYRKEEISQHFSKQFPNGFLFYRTVKNKAPVYERSCLTKFDGSASTVIGLPEKATILGNGARTIVFDMRTTQTGKFVILSTGSASRCNAFNIRSLGGGRIGIMGHTYDVDPDKDKFSGKSANDGSWHQVVVSYDGSMLTLYLDGALVAQEERGVYDTKGYSNFLGRSNHKGFESFYEGEIRDFAIYDKDCATDVKKAPPIEATPTKKKDYHQAKERTMKRQWEDTLQAHISYCSWSDAHESLKPGSSCVVESKNWNFVRPRRVLVPERHNDKFEVARLLIVKTGWNDNCIGPCYISDEDTMQWRLKQDIILKNYSALEDKYDKLEKQLDNLKSLKIEWTKNLNNDPAPPMTDAAIT